MDDPYLWSYAARSQPDPDSFGIPFLAGKLVPIFYTLNQGIKRPGTVSPHLMHKSHLSKICIREISCRRVSFKEISLNIA